MLFTVLELILALLLLGGEEDEAANVGEAEAEKVVTEEEPLGATAADFGEAEDGKVVTEAEALEVTAADLGEAEDGKVVTEAEALEARANEVLNIKSSNEVKYNCI